MPQTLTRADQAADREAGYTDRHRLKNGVFGKIPISSRPREEVTENETFRAQRKLPPATPSIR
jgi:hypothetical protein